MIISIFHRVRRHAAEFGWVAVGSAASMVASLLTLKYLTHVLAPSEFGELNLVLAALILPTWIVYAPISQAAVRMYSQENEAGRADRLFRVTVTSYVFAAVGVLSVAAVGGLVGANSWLGVSLSSWFVAAFLLVTESFVVLSNGFANAARRRKRVAAINALMVWMRLGLAVLSNIWFPARAEVILGAYLLGTALAVMPACSAFPGGVSFQRLDRDDRDLLRRMLAYGIPFGIWSSFAWAQQYIDRYAVDVLLGRHWAGVYIAALQVSAIAFTAIGVVVSQFLTPIVFEIAGDGRDPARMHRAAGHVKQVVAWLAIAGAIPVAAYYLGGQWITGLLASPAFALPNTWLAVLAAGALLQVCAQQLTVLFMASHRSHHLLVSRTILGLTGILVAWTLTSAWGMAGAVGAYVTNSALFLATMALSIKWLVGDDRSVTR